VNKQIERGLSTLGLDFHTPRTIFDESPKLELRSQAKNKGPEPHALNDSIYYNRYSRHFGPFNGRVRQCPAPGRTFNFSVPRKSIYDYAKKFVSAQK
jgi:hypothetical protein